MARIRVRRGKRHSLILEFGRWRFRAVPGRFRWGLRDAPGGWTFAGKLFLVTAMRRNYVPE